MPEETFDAYCDRKDEERARAKFDAWCERKALERHERCMAAKAERERGQAGAASAATSGEPTPGRVPNEPVTPPTPAASVPESVTSDERFADAF